MFNSVYLESSFYSAKNARAPQTTTDPSSFVAANAPYVPHTWVTPQIVTTDTVSQIKLLRRQVCSDGLLKHGIVILWFLFLWIGPCWRRVPQPTCLPPISLWPQLTTDPSSFTSGRLPSANHIHWGCASCAHAEKNPLIHDHYMTIHDFPYASYYIISSRWPPRKLHMSQRWISHPTAIMVLP